MMVVPCSCGYHPQSHSCLPLRKPNVPVLLLLCRTGSRSLQYPIPWRRIKSQTKMSDDSSAFFALFFIFFQKFLCARESDLGNIALYFILGHTNTIIRYDQLLFSRCQWWQSLLAGIRLPAVSLQFPEGFPAFLIASQPLETISLKKMSLSEYSHFLMIGNMFFELTLICPSRFIAITSQQNPVIF